MASKSFVFRFDDMEVSEREFSLTKAGKVLTVEPKSFRALLFLLHNPQRLISKEELLNSVWGDAAVTEGSLTRCIWLLRSVLGDDIRKPRYIETVATVGYRFISPVEVFEGVEVAAATNPENSINGSAGETIPAALFAIDEALTATSGIVNSAVQSGPAPAWWQASWKLWFAVALLAIGAGLGMWKLSAWLATPARRVLRVAVSLPASQRFVDYDGGNSVMFTPDGSAIVYSGLGPRGNQLYYRRLDQLEGAVVPGTENSCCWAISPLGDWVAFGSAPNIIWKVSLRGGSPIALGTSGYLGGFAFGPDDSIYSAEANAGLFRIPADGGPKQLIAKPVTARGETTWAMPMVLPDGKSVLAMSYKKSGGTILVKVRIADGEVTELEGNAANPIGLAGGYLLFGRSDGKLGVVPFDPDNTRSVEGVIPVLDSPLERNSGLEAAVSRAGDLVYVKATDRSRIIFLDAQGRVTGGIPGERNFDPDGISVSPDGRQIAARELADSVLRRGDLSLYDVASGVRQPLTTVVDASSPEWTPDGRRVVYILGSEIGPDEAWSVPADRSGPPERLISMPIEIEQIVLSRDSRYAVLQVFDPAKRFDLYLVDLKGDRKPQVLEKSSFNESYPKISPDGHWLAYVSDETGHDEVYLRPFPGGGAHVKVSADGGDDPRWENDSRGIVYRTASQFMKASLAVGANIAVTKRDLLFSGPYTGYDLLPSGSIVAFRPESADAEIIVVTNWLDELKAELGKK